MTKLQQNSWGLGGNFSEIWSISHGMTQKPCTFFLAKEKIWKCIFNIKSELSHNHAEKQIVPFKTTVNWLFNIWCYLVIAFFDWKIGVFQQTVLRVYCILKLIQNNFVCLMEKLVQIFKCIISHSSAKSLVPPLQKFTIQNLDLILFPFWETKLA